MAICKFFANGYCRYGDSCRYEHIDNRQSSRNNNNNSSNNSKSYDQMLSHHGSNSRLNYDQSYQQQQQQKSVGSDGRASFSFNRTATQIPQTSNSTFSFNRKTASQIQQPSSTFSFNKAAEMESSSGPKTFSFANTHHRVNMGGGSGSTAVYGTPTTGSFSFNAKLAQVQNEKAGTHFFQQQPQTFSSFFGKQTPNPLPTTSFFGNTQQQPQQPTTSFFGNTQQQPQQPTTSFFGKTQQQPQQPSQTLSFFNVASNAGSSIFGGSDKSHSGSQFANFSFNGKDPNDGGLNAKQTATANVIASCQWYTPLEKLTDRDKALFEQKEFTSIIPLVPPPFEMCH